MRDCLGSEERKARANAQESHLRRRDAEVLEFMRCYRRRRFLGNVGYAELRQRRTDANRAYGAVRISRAFSQRADGRGLRCIANSARNWHSALSHSPMRRKLRSWSQPPTAS